MKNTIRASIITGVLVSIIMVMGLMGCGDDSGPAATGDIEFKMSFDTSADNSTESRSHRALGDPDVCTDYGIDTIKVELRSTSNDELIELKEPDCSEYGLTLSNVPANEKLYLLCKGQRNAEALWEGMVDVFEIAPNETKDLGTISLSYIGADEAAPETISRFPEDGADNVDLKAWIALNFSEALATGSISEKALTVMSDGLPVAGKLDCHPSAHTLVFTPDAPEGFAAETTYTVRFQPMGDDGRPVTDMAGHPFEGEQTWEFTTGGVEDTIAPQIIATIPADGAIRVKKQSAVLVLFSEPLNPETLGDGVFRLTSVQGDVSGNIEYDEQTRTATLTPDSDLLVDHEYTAEITSQAADTAQNILSEPYSWAFHTAMESYTITTSIEPADGTGGTIHPLKVTVYHGESKNFSITPKPLHKLLELYVDGTKVAKVNNYTLGNVTADRTIKAVFEKINLIGHWTFDGHVNDVEGNYNGTRHGGGRFTGVGDNTLNQALEFDGNADYVETEAIIDDLSEFTVSAWVKIPEEIQPGWGHIFEYDRGGGQWFALAKALNRDCFALRWNDGATGFFLETISPDIWYHVVGTFGDGTAKTFLNGTLSKTFEPATRPSNPATWAKARIGLNQHNKEGIRALIDDVRLYDAALSDNDVQTLYDSTAADHERAE